MNFNPACATSRRLGRPGHQGSTEGGTGLRKTKAGWGRRHCELPLTESSWQRGQTRRPPPPERDSQGEPGTAAATLRPGPGTTARAPRCLFGCGQLPAAAAQQPCARAQAPPGDALSATERLSGHQPPDPRPPERGQTSFLRGPPAAPAGRQLPRQAALVSGGRRPRPAWRGSSLPSPTPSPERAPRGPRASAPTKPAAGRRPGEGPGVAAGRRSPGKAPLGRARAAPRGSGDVAGRERGRKCPALGAKASSARPHRPAPPA